MFNLFDLQTVCRKIDAMGYEAVMHLTANSLLLYVTGQNQPLGRDVMMLVQGYDFAYLKSENRNGWIWQVFAYA